MPDFLCITVRFLQSYSHGRSDQGQPEWPPSPLRLFQALGNASAARWNERLRLSHATEALRWLENLPAPMLVAPLGTPSSRGCRYYVPDNSADLCVPAWRRGELTKQVVRTEKSVRPVFLGGEDVHYLFSLADSGMDLKQHLETLYHASRSITHLGWGVDMVVGNAEVISEDEAARLPGQRWLPTADGSGIPLRVPTVGTVDALMQKYDAFLHRLGSDGLHPVPPLTVFRTVRYCRETDVMSRPFVAFNLLELDASGFRAVNTARGCRDVAAWTRHAVSSVCDGWPFDNGSIAGFVHGHGPGGEPLQDGPRFSYLPLPSIQPRGERGEYVGAIRRVLVVAPPGYEDRIDWLRRRLPNTELVRDDGVSTALLNLLPGRDWVLRRYVDHAPTWTTVTPVVLPGHDDHDMDKAEALIWKAFRHAGFSDQLLQQTFLEFRKVGFLPGLDFADRYSLPERPRVKGPRYHVRVVFPHDIPGPIAVGALRYRGLGVLASVL